MKIIRVRKKSYDFMFLLLCFLTSSLVPHAFAQTPENSRIDSNARGAVVLFQTYWNSWEFYRLQKDLFPCVHSEAFQDLCLSRVVSVLGFEMPESFDMGSKRIQDFVYSRARPKFFQYWQRNHERMLEIVELLRDESLADDDPKIIKAAREWYKIGLEVALPSIVDFLLTNAVPSPETENLKKNLLTHPQYLDLLENYWVKARYHPSLYSDATMVESLRFFFRDALPTNENPENRMTGILASHFLKVQDALKARKWPKVDRLKVEWDYAPQAKPLFVHSGGLIVGFWDLFLNEKNFSLEFRLAQRLAEGLLKIRFSESKKQAEKVKVCEEVESIFSLLLASKSFSKTESDADKAIKFLGDKGQEDIRVQVITRFSLIVSESLKKPENIDLAMGYFLEGTLNYSDIENRPEDILVMVNQKYKSLNDVAGPLSKQNNRKKQTAALIRLKNWISELEKNPEDFSKIVGLDVFGSETKFNLARKLGLDFIPESELIPKTNDPEEEKEFHKQLEKELKKLNSVVKLEIGKQVMAYYCQRPDELVRLFEFLDAPEALDQNQEFRDLAKTWFLVSRVAGLKLGIVYILDHSRESSQKNKLKNELIWPIKNSQFNNLIGNPASKFDGTVFTDTEISHLGMESLKSTWSQKGVKYSDIYSYDLFPLASEVQNIAFRKSFTKLISAKAPSSRIKFKPYLGSDEIAYNGASDLSFIQVRNTELIEIDLVRYFGLFGGLLEPEQDYPVVFVSLFQLEFGEKFNGNRELFMNLSEVALMAGLLDREKKIDPKKLPDHLLVMAEISPEVIEVLWTLSDDGSGGRTWGAVHKMFELFAEGKLTWEEIYMSPKKVIETTKAAYQK